MDNICGRLSEKITVLRNDKGHTCKICTGSYIESIHCGGCNFYCILTADNLLKGKPLTYDALCPNSKECKIHLLL